MEIVKFIAALITSVLFVYLGVYSLYLFIFSAAGKLIKVKKPGVSPVHYQKFVIYICSYK